MRRLSRLFLLAFVAAMSSNVFAVTYSQDQLEVFRHSLKDVENATRMFSVDLLYSSSTTYPPNVGMVKSSKIKYLEDGNGRVRIAKDEIRSLKFDQEKVEENVEVLAAFDGSTMKQYETCAGRFQVGRLSQNPGDTPWTPYPRDFLTHYFSEPVSNLIAKGKIVEENNDGTMVIESEERHPGDGSTRKYRFTVSDDLTIHKREVLMRPPMMDAWYVYGRVISEGFIEASSGVLVPTHCIDEAYDLQPIVDGLSESPVLANRTEFSLADWNFSPVIDDSIFTITFPNGTTVNDLVRGTTYVVGESISDDALDGLVEETKRSASSPSGRLLYKYFFVAGNAILLIAVVLYVFILKR